MREEQIRGHIKIRVLWALFSSVFCVRWCLDAERNLHSNLHITSSVYARRQFSPKFTSNGVVITSKLPRVITFVKRKHYGENKQVPALTSSHGLAARVIAQRWLVRLPSKQERCKSGKEQNTYSIRNVWRLLEVLMSAFVCHQSFISCQIIDSITARCASRGVLDFSVLSLPQS